MSSGPLYSDQVSIDVTCWSRIYLDWCVTCNISQWGVRRWSRHSCSVNLKWESKRSTISIGITPGRYGDVLSWYVKSISLDTHSSICIDSRIRAVVCDCDSEWLFSHKNSLKVSLNRKTIDMTGKSSIRCGYVVIVRICCCIFEEDTASSCC